ncbi:hypothetical protein IEQ34_000150 [Dendrobium chrysotoxum]|uniref:Uncharacterized protein n=1 Tax=Dendrobium chrysotoxum TaxID=161865 RepID=A0AAV7HNC6_DENCH|nr:hypothetical protein IEQ34_000150 [Dendrobium chrysotoxum]
MSFMGLLPHFPSLISSPPLIVLTGNFSATLFDRHYVLIKLENDLDSRRFFGHRLYYVCNCFMKLINWSPLF